ncbi:hypothetical protein SARC_07915, partial [Sphaeroforma arctica JP610]
ELFSAYKHELVEYCEEQQHRLTDALFRMLRILKTRAIQLAQVSTACVALIALNVDIEYLREKKSQVLASPWVNESLRTQLELLSETGLFQITLGETAGGAASQQTSVSDHKVELETRSGLVANSDLVVGAPPSPTLSDER